MKREDFDQPTNPEDMTESAELPSTEKCGEAEDTLAVHEGSITRAEKILSVHLTLENVAPGPPKMKKSLDHQSPFLELNQT